MICTQLYGLKNFKQLDDFKYLTNNDICITLSWIYLYCHPQTDSFVVLQIFSVARHVRRLKLGSKPAQLSVRCSIIPLNQQVNHTDTFM